MSEPVQEKTVQPAYMTSTDLYQILREEILTLKIQPGALVSENNISRRFGLSRTPVRSCFERLRQDGFLEVIPKKGTFVTLIDLDMAEQIIYMRLQLEVGVMCYLAQHPDPVLFDRLARNLQEQKNQLDVGVNYKVFYKLDSQFHEQCFVAVDKPKLWQIVQNMDVHYSRYRQLDYLATRKFVTLYHEHKNMLSLMQEGRVSEVRQAVTMHLYGGFLRIGNRLMTEYEGFFQDSERDIDEILLCIKKQVHESGSLQNEGGAPTFKKG